MHSYRTVEEIKKIPMFFIVGSPRSGTTMLQQMLDANPNLIIPLESPWIIVLKKQFFKIKKWDKKLLSEFIEELYHDKKFVDLWKIDREKLTGELHSYPMECLDFQVLVKIVYLNYPSIYEKKSFSLIGDKNPEYSVYIDLLTDIFPQAKFIHIIRDYRPNILSNRKWFLQKRISVLAFKWLFFNLIIEKVKKKNPSLFYTVRYEDLVASPEFYAREIASFLNFEYVDAMVRFHERTNEVYLSEENYEKFLKFSSGLHKNLIKPINTENVDKWKEEMKPFEVEIADYIAGDYADKYGYERVYRTGNLSLFKEKIIGFVVLKFDVSIRRFYHKYVGKYGRRVLRLFSIFAYKTIGFSHMFNPELRDELKKKRLNR